MAASKVFTGVIWASVQRFGTMIISFVTNIVLARLLTPDDFGTIGMLLLFFAIANTFVDSGFGSALIQKKDATETDFSTVFYINLMLSGIVYSVLFAGAPWVASFYNVEILCPLLRVQGIILILNAFCIIQTALLRKKMDFRKLSICNLIGNIAGSVIGIGAALLGYGVWSLVIRTLVVGLVTSVLLWIVGKWKPLMAFSKESFKELFGFGGFMLLSNLVYNISNNVQTLIIGKIFKPSDLGNFTQARQLRNVATDSVSSVISQVLYPEFANNQKDNKILIDKLNLSVSVISFLSIGVMSLCILLARHLIILLYGYKWINCVVFFQILCFAGCFIALQDVNINIVAAKGKSKILFYCNVAKMILFLIILLVGAEIYGLLGLVIGNTLYTIIAYSIFSLLSSYYLKYSVIQQYFLLMKPALIALIPSIIVLLINNTILSTQGSIIIIIVDTFFFSLLYWALSERLNIKGCLYLKNVIFNIFKKKH